MRPGTTWLVPLVLLAACGPGAKAPRASSANQPVSTGTPATTGPTVDPKGVAVTTGETTGRPEPWSHARIAGERAVLLWSAGCGSPEGTEAVVFDDRVTITVYWPADDRGVGGPPRSCPPAATVQRIELPQPVGDRAVVDGAPVGTRRPIRWKRADLVFDDRTVRLRIDDPACASLPLVHLVETDREVIISADVAAEAGPVPGHSCADDPYLSDFTLLAPLDRREIIDGACWRDAGTAGCGRVS